MKDEIGKVCAFTRDGKRLAGKIVSSEELVESLVPDYSIVVEGRSGKRLTLPSYNEAEVRICDSWEEADEDAKKWKPSTNVDSESTGVGSVKEKAEPVEESSPGEVPREGTPGGSGNTSRTLPAPAEATEAVHDLPSRGRRHQLDRIEAALTLALVALLDKNRKTVEDLIDKTARTMR